MRQMGYLVKCTWEKMDERCVEVVIRVVEWVRRLLAF